MKKDHQKTIFLIDGSSFLYRAYYGMRPLHTSKGEPVHAVYGFCRMIKKLIDRFSAQHIALVWDSKGPTLRHELYEQYKATRQAPPHDLFDQKEHIVSFATMIGLHQVSKAGYEADDLMFSIARDMAQQKYDVVLVTSDKDMGQVLDARVSLYDYFKEEMISKELFEQKRGFPVEKLPFYFALLGDSSDNIPGVRGVGKQTAQQLVNQFDSLEDLYARIETIEKPRIKNALIANKDNAFLSQKLFLLVYVQTNTTPEACALNVADWRNARPLFEKLEFKQLLAQAGVSKQERQALVDEQIAALKKRNFRMVTTPEALAQLVTEIRQAGVVAIDTETNGLDPRSCIMVGISICTQEKVAYYIPFGHQTDEPQLAYEQVRQALQDVFADTTITKYFHNAKFDIHMLAAQGLAVKGPLFDTLIAASLVTKDWQRISLKQLALYYFNEHMLTFAQVVKDQKLPNFAHVPLDIATCYSANDAYQTFKLASVFQDELKKEGMMDLFEAIEMPLMHTLCAMESRGIYADKAVLQELDQHIAQTLGGIEKEIIAMIPSSHAAINLNSPKQIEQLLFYTLHLPPQKKSGKRTGYSTDQDVLETLSKLHPVPGLILKYRELYKLQSTYAQSLQDHINERDNRIHTTFSQTRVATGRLASSEPNLQNLPASGAGLAIRGAFKAAPGKLFISADYSQIELRVLAYLSQDKAFIDAFHAGRDIHRETAARLFEVPFDQVSHEQRQIGKRINFSILYGLTAYGLSKDLKIPFADAKHYIEKYFAQFPNVREWMERVINEVKAHGYVTTHWGRRRYIPAIYEKNKVLYDEAVRIAINTIAQGTAAEIVKKGMVTLNEKLGAMDATMLLQIHDELVVEAPQQHADRVAQMIKETLESVVDWNVPLVASTRIGADWREISK